MKTNGSAAKAVRVVASKAATAAGFAGMIAMRPSDRMELVESKLERKTAAKIRYQILAAVEKNLVEAAGIEPASEIACPEKNYVRFRFLVLGEPLWNRQVRGSPSSIGFQYQAPNRNLSTNPVI